MPTSFILYILCAALPISLQQVRNLHTKLDISDAFLSVDCMHKLELIMAIELNKHRAYSLYCTHNNSCKEKTLKTSSVL